MSAVRWWRVQRASLGRRDARPGTTSAASGSDPTGSGRTADRQPRALDSAEIFVYRVIGDPAASDRYVGIFCGDMRRARCADVWVNSENTDMQMARWNEFSVSSIIRFEGAARDVTGRVVDDRIANELAHRMAGRAPVPPGTTVHTGAGELARYGVRHIVHVAAVQGEPGAGFRQVREIGRCVTSALTEVDRIDERPPPGSVLFPLLGVGHGGGEPHATVVSMVGAALDYLTDTPNTHVKIVYLLGYTDLELAVCARVFGAHPRLEVLDSPQAATIAHEFAPRTMPEPSHPMVAAGTNPARRSLRMGFVIDIVGYGARSAPAQETAQRRLFGLAETMLGCCGVILDEVDRQWMGDGVNVILPGTADPTTALPELVHAAARLLGEDNQRYEDRIRLRMAVGMGIVGHGATGFAGSLVVDINRLVDSEPLRATLKAHPDADLAVLLSDQVHQQVVRPGYPGLRISDLEAVEVAVKEFRQPAWLWIARPGRLDVAGQD
jgi:O-acetyl-ADP-ribose deacetylase (regulator of RNase III)